MTGYEASALPIAAAHVVVGLMQVAIVAYGIRAMRTMGERRAREQSGTPKRTSDTPRRCAPWKH